MTARFPIAAFAAGLPDASARDSFALHCMRSDPGILLRYVTHYGPEDWRRKRKSVRL